jgi:hypothetical protein
MTLAPGRAPRSSFAEAVDGSPPYPIGYGGYPKGFGAHSMPSVLIRRER